MRPSTEVQIKNVWTFAASLIVGVAMLAGGGFFLYLEMTSGAVHNAHVFTFAGLAVLGALVISPGPIVSSVKQVIVVVGPYLPVIGGRRKEDPPA